MTAKRHHYVPETLMKPWTRSGGLVRGYYWDHRRQTLRYKELGPKAFCCLPNLFTLKSAAAVPDAIEREFFQMVDTAGAAARDKLNFNGVRSLKDTERSDFIRLLLSLDTRRPSVVKKLREGGEFLREQLDNDPEVRRLAARERISSRPSIWFEQQTGVLYEDEALSLIQSTTDNPRIGNILMNAGWGLRRLGPTAPEVVLSDRPLIRFGSTLSLDFVWVLPLSPKLLFFITPDEEKARRISRASDKVLVHNINSDSVAQADKFVFSIGDHFDRSWLGKRMRAKPKAEPEAQGSGNL